MTMNDSQELDILRQLRKENGLTHDDMARLCGLHGKQRRMSASDWENGNAIPAPARRSRFLRYLWDHLLLRKDPARFETVWDVLVMEWGWEPISDREWSSLTSTPRPPRPQEIDARLEELAATLEQLQNGNLVAENRPSALDGVVTLPVDALPDLAPLPKGSRMPLARNPLFVGRHHELLDLAHAFSANSTTAISQVETAAATGLGGIGKTQLATEFVHRYGQFFWGGVYWLSFDNANAVSSEVAACGGAGAMELRADFAAQSLEDQVRLVQAAWQQPTPRLLIFDNCEEPELLTQWRPTSGGCRVLVTSRRGEWEPSLNVHHLILTVFSRQESVQLLRSHCPDGDEIMLDAIAAELGDLPLALHLAGSYLYRYRRAITPKQYLVHLRKPYVLRHPSLDSRGISPTAHVQNVGRTFALSYERLSPNNSDDEFAIRILGHMANLAPGEPIWLDILLRSLGLDAENLDAIMQSDEAFGRLIELGLIQGENQDEMRIHRLVAAFVEDVTPEESPIYRKKIESAVLDKLQQANEAATPHLLAAWNVHIRYVVDVALSYELLWSAQLAAAFGQHLWHTGNFSESQIYLEKALSIRSDLLGELHLETAKCHSELGFVLREMHQFSKSRFHLQKAVRLYEELQCEESAEFANALNELGQVCAFESKNNEALALLQRAYDICLRVLGPQHLRTAEVANNLGLMWLDIQQNPQEALAFFEQALEIRISQLGKKHYYNALSYHNLGYALDALGDLEGAKAAYEQALELNIELLSAEHVTTLLTQCMLGGLLTRMGELARARDYLERAAIISLRIFGDTHLISAVSNTQLGLNYQQGGDYAKAKEHLLYALTIREKVYGEENLSIAETLEFLGHLELEQGDYQDALCYFQRCLSIRQRFLKADHPLVQKLRSILDS